MSEILSKVLGTDFELGNMLYTPGHAFSRPREAADRLLLEFDGYPHRRFAHGSVIEYGRRFLPGSGGSVYIDSDHLELNTAEHLRASDHGIHLHAGLRMARRAQIAASRHLPSGTHLRVFANNCDGHVSYGRHTNVLTSSHCFQDILYRKPHLGAFLATHLVTSVLFTGQGMVGAANGKPACDYQLSQRADWFERFASLDTMLQRPLLNLRDESHAGDGLARLHIIYYDMVLSQIANCLLAGTTQLVVAMCEAGWADPTLLLGDPVGCASVISRDLTLAQKLPMAARGKSATALEIQQRIADLAAEFVATEELYSVIPGADEIITLWHSTLLLLRERALEALAGRCDNWLKFLLLDRHRARRGVAWQTDEMRLLDQRFGNLDPSEGLFFQMVDAGVVEGMPSDSHIDAFIDEPPEDTRAYLRAHILRRFGELTEQVNWSSIDFRVAGPRGWSSSARIDMPDPRRHTRGGVRSNTGR